MVQFSDIIIIYFVIGASLWGVGLIEWDNSGLGGILIEAPGDGDVNEQTSSDLENLGGPIQEAANSLGAGALLAVWNILVKFLGFLFYPIVTLQGLNAPPRAVVLLGGTTTMAFLGSVIKLVRTSA